METEKTAQKKELHSFIYGVLLTLECAIWGFSNAFSKLGFEAITPLWALAMRYLVSIILFLTFFGKRIITRFQKSAIKPCLIVSLFTAAAFVLGFVALDNTSATNSGFLMSLAVVFVPVLSVFVLKTRFEYKFIIPVAIAAAGLFLICGGRLDSLCLGDILAILCSCASAMMLIFSVKYLSNADIEPLVLCIIQCAVCFAVCLPLALIFEPLPDIIHMAPIGWYMLAVISVGGTFLAYLFQNIALSRVSPTFGALVFCTEPIFTAITAYFMLGERMGLLSISGAILITVGIVLASIFDSRRDKG